MLRQEAPNHVEKIRNSKTPSNMKQTRVFCRLSDFLWTNDTRFGYKYVNFERNSKRRLQMGKTRTERFRKQKMSCANPLVQPYSLTKEATVITDASIDTIGALLSQEGNPVIYVKEVVTSPTKLLQYWARGTCNRLCGHEIELSPARKEVHHTD